MQRYFYIMKNSNFVVERSPPNNKLNVSTNYVWALVVPGNPLNFVDFAMSGVIAGFASFFVSTFLNILTPFFEKMTPKAP